MPSILHVRPCARTGRALRSGLQAKTTTLIGRPPPLPARTQEAEAAVYDRQIRVWGFETQKRLSNARVLFVNLPGVAAEASGDGRSGESA